MDNSEFVRDATVEKNFFVKTGRKVRGFFTDPERLTDLLSCAVIFVFISLVFAVALKVNGIFPFGKSVMSSYDMLAQVAPFIEHFFDVIDGKSSLFYSFSIAGGADVFGTLAYCCISPFTFVFLLFGKGNVYYGTSIVLPLKIICIGISAYVYLRKRFKNLSPLLRIALSLSYAFCGYLYVSNTYINWVDILIYVPVLAWGFRKLVKTGQKSTFIVGLCLIIYTCFSIACFSLLIIYPLAIAYCYIVVPKAERRKTIVDLVLALCLAVAFSLPVLIPALYAYLVSGRSSGLFNGLFGELKPDPLYYKISYIFTDGLTLFFTFAYLVKNGVKRPIDRFLLLAALITLMPILCDECCIVLNFGSYNSYAMRFGFLNGFYFLFVAAKFLNGFATEKAGGNAPFQSCCKFNEEQEISRQSGVVRITKVNIVCAVLLTFFSFGFFPIYWIYLIVKNSHLLQNKSTFQKKSCICEVLCLLFVPFYSWYWWYKNGEKNKKAFTEQGYHSSSSGVLFLVLAIFGFGIINEIIIQNDFNQIDGVDSYELQITKWTFSLTLAVLCIGALVGGYFLCVAAQGDKIEKWFSSRFAHSLGGLEVTAIVFGIVAIIALYGTFLIKNKKIDRRFFAIIMLVIVCGQSAFYTENLVYGNKKETTDFDRIGVLTDFIKTTDDGEYSRIKMKQDYLTADMPFTLHTQAYSVFSSVIDDKNYAPARFFAYGGNGSNTIKSYYGTFFGDCILGNRYYISNSASVERNYTAVVGYDVDKNGNKLDTGDYRLYKNNYAFPNAFVVGGRAGDFNTDDFKNGNLYDKYSVLVKALGGKEATVDVATSPIRVSALEDGAYRLSYTRNELGNYFVVLDFGDKTPAKYSLGSGENKYDVENNSVCLYKFGSNYSTFTLYFDDATLTADDVSNGVSLYCITDETVKAISAGAQARAGKSKLSAGTISVTASAEEGEYLFLNYIALPGHRATVNGKVVDIDDNLLGFMLIPLEKGENNIVVSYSSPYVKYAVFGLIAALLVGFAYLILTKKTKLFGEVFAKVINIAALALCAVVVAVFMVFPLGVFVYKFVYFVIQKIAGLFA